MTLTANDLLMSSGGKSATFPTVGTVVTGTITAEPKAQQQTDMKTGEPKTFQNGDPMMQIIVSLQTTDREDDEDDGIRQLYVKANMLKAIREAVQTAGAKGLEPGGVLTVKYVADGEVKTKGFNPPKLYAATYAKPTGAAANNLLMGAATPVGGQVTVGGTTFTKVSENPFPPAAPAGIDPAVWAALDPSQRQAILAAQTNTNTPPF